MLRLIDIFYVLIKYDLDDFFLKNYNHKLLYVAKLTFKNLFKVKESTGSLGFRIRCALQELGPVFVKFGQILSSRPDIVPRSIINELNHLKDNVVPFDIDTVKEVIQSNLKGSIDDLFKEFDETPVAAGSVAQVHYAKLYNGDEVAVKILRPGIGSIINQDLSLFKKFFNLILFYRPELKKINFKKVIEELERSINLELDFEVESENIIKFSSNMSHLSYIKVPKVYKSLTSKNVLTMERMYGFPIDKINELKKYNVDINKVAQQGLEALILQVFRYGFFHADQHSGNLWITPDGSRIYLDFGIMGEISEHDRKNLLKIVFFLYSKKPLKLLESLKDAGWISKIYSVDEFVSDINTISEGFVNKQQKDFSLGNIFNNFLNILNKYDSNIPYQFTLLAKTLLVTEGTIRQLAPELNLQKEAIPILVKYFK